MPALPSQTCRTVIRDLPGLLSVSHAAGAVSSSPATRHPSWAWWVRSLQRAHALLPGGSCCQQVCAAHCKGVSTVGRSMLSQVQVWALIATETGRGTGQGWLSRTAVPRGWAGTLTGRAFHTEETDSTSPGEAGPAGPTTPSITAGESGTVGPRSEVPEGSILIPSEQVTLGAAPRGNPLL